MFDLSPSSGAILLLDPTEPSAGALPLASLIRAVSCPPDERVITLDITRLRGRARRVQLVIELLTNAWNAILTEGGDGRIRSVLRRRQSADRSLQPGASYRPPRASGRKGRREPLSLESWLELLARVEASERTSTLVRNVAFTSRLSASAFLGVSGAPEARAGDVERALTEGWSRWLDWRVLRAVEPHVLTLPGGPQPYPYPMPGLVSEQRETVIAALSAAASDAAPHALLVPAELLDALAERVRAGESKLSRLQDQLAQLDDPTQLRALGDLLLARMQDVPRGASSVTLEGFEGKTTRISVDPTLAPHENAARYYDRAARSERANETLPALIEEAGAQLEAWYVLEEDAREGRVDLETLRRRIGEPRPGRAAKRGDLAPRLPYYRFRSSMGTEIRVGRNARSNDELTFHHSDPDDVWLHARHGAGAHVVLRWRGEGNPAASDLEGAATLAAVNSKGRTSGSVPVDWTRRKYVRKPRKAPAGTVVIERAKTVFVSPDPTIVERLAWRDDG